MQNTIQDLQKLSGFVAQDGETLRAVADQTGPWVDEIVQDFYNTLFGYESTAQIFRPGERPHREETFRRWYFAIINGDYSETFWNQQWRVGLIHVERRVTNAMMLGMMSRVQQLFLQKCLATFPDQALSVYAAFKRVTDVASGLIAESYLEEYVDDAHHARHTAESANQAKSQFLANMSHELRTPLNTIIGYSHMLQKESQAAGLTEFAEDLERVERAGNHLLTLVNSILYLSKIEAGKLTLTPEVFEVSALIDDLAAALRPLVQQNNNVLITDLAPHLGAMHSDLTRTREILFNLLGNATKFTHDGTITLRVTRSAPGGVAAPGNPPTPATLTASQWLHFAVSDTGVGMSAEQVSQLFQEFTQVHSNSQGVAGGTGLGLAISQQLAHLMGGNITVESQPNQGSTFTLSLPDRLPANAPIEPKATPPPVPAPAAKTTTGQTTVLIIDDDPSIQNLLKRTLTPVGFQVHQALNGGEGLKLATELHPDLILLDVFLPDRDGWSVLVALKADPALATVPIIMHTIVESQRLGFTLGAVEYLIKPVEQEQLVGTLNKYRPAVKTEQEPQGQLLIVDDNPDTRGMMRRMLVPAGWTILEAAHGREALALLAKERPTLILLDLVMPEMDGFEFIATFRETSLGKTTPIIVLTAKELTQEEQARLQGSTQRILHKEQIPINNLVQEIHTLLGHLRAHEAQAPQQTKIATILMVEDNEPNLRLLTRFASRYGYRSVVARNGAEGVALAESELPDLILMDLNMPVMDGLEAMRQIKHNPSTSHIPIIALTANAMEGTRRHLIAAGFDEYESKPVNLPHLLTTIQSFLK